MPKRHFIKGNLHRADHLRALVTDTMPAEVPIIFSNDGFYLNEKARSDKSLNAQTLLAAILDRDPKQYSIPYRYRVTKDTISTRMLSLLHPSSQIDVANFYKKYEELICHYNSRSPFSIRAPAKVGSTYFFSDSMSDKNKKKGSSIDTVQFEKRVRNPASFFSYTGFDRLHKFFDSDKFLRLEKTFPVMWFGDVSKCFDSIYTHTLTWAVKDMPTSKKHTGSISFGSNFDALMQKMNYNETNGICIGPEISRIFAETILQRVDLNVIEISQKMNLKLGVDFTCIRYVDDIKIFARSEGIAEKIYSIFEECLREFKLHLNDQKLQKFSRPFQTSKSKIIHQIKLDLSKFYKTVTSDHKDADGNILAPAYLFRPSSVRASFLSNIKSTCMSNNAGYEMAANYVISSLSNLLENILDGFTRVHAVAPVSIENYHRIIMLLLELMFFFYTVAPTVNTSFRLSRSIVEAIRFTEKHDKSRSNFLIEQLTKWVSDFVKSVEEAPRHLQTQKIPVEVLNIMIALCESSKKGHFSQEFIENFLFDKSKVDYFSLVSTMFVVQNENEYSSLKNYIQIQLTEFFNQRADVKMNSHDAHMFLDIVCCPYLDIQVRSEIVRTVSDKVTDLQLSLIECRALVEELEQNHWFINWERIDLLNMIKRKELSAVY